MTTIPKKKKKLFRPQIVSNQAHSLFLDLEGAQLSNYCLKNISASNVCKFFVLFSMLKTFNPHRTKYLLAPWLISTRMCKGKTQRL